MSGMEAKRAIAMVGWWLFGVGAAWLALPLTLLAFVEITGVEPTMPDLLGGIVYFGWCPCGPLLTLTGGAILLAYYVGDYGR
jgi:hypothetical protein